MFPDLKFSNVIFVLLLEATGGFVLKDGLSHSRSCSLNVKKSKVDGTKHKGFGAEAKCICGSNLLTSKCCSRMQSLQERALASPAEIVRSRYSAYALGDWEYIVKTTHPTSSSFTQDRKQWLTALRDQPYQEYRFLGVNILEESIQDQENAIVLFLAKLLHKKNKDRADFTERSFFKRDDTTQGWLYVGGDVDAPGTVVDLRTGQQLDSDSVLQGTDAIDISSSSPTLSSNLER
mmetsp:Transcript_19613/g.25388  ORF Transcript_19613/g.25388 Transcript_19613/m.25388 type:complete len:234 (+) Transcript_19613:103-804(+)|eukprot:CAMPEP_0197295576 /NCGR_PEP_ID=MMETSP0890-20130614/35937_1 /TAXON_ID=44058 ORGANISM="Aureoumbra lagunensis, Strain CCMP1510" /NCGR_SAMPLE_ID=MMETSP0890 /ASSEMBLY_ACC=CAM_ASM_000533 /LENGTH=233 /DNA_ID=CAMNT_0042771651 /DNA_START=25 /DNA_END=726 /DNA_ORIENTATION=-